MHYQVCLVVEILLTLAPVELTCDDFVGGLLLYDLVGETALCSQLTQLRYEQQAGFSRSLYPAIKLRATLDARFWRGDAICKPLDGLVVASNRSTSLAADTVALRTDTRSEHGESPLFRKEIEASDLEMVLQHLVPNLSSKRKIASSCKTWGPEWLV